MKKNKKEIIHGQAGGLATLKKYGHGHFEKMAIRMHRKKRRMNILEQKWE